MKWLRNAPSSRRHGGIDRVYDTFERIWDEIMSMTKMVTNITKMIAETRWPSLARADDNDGVIILTDMFGGTPSNLAISIMDSAAARKEIGAVEVIAGVNLPMLIKLASVRSEKPLAEVVAEAQEAGRKYINVASALLQKGD